MFQVNIRRKRKDYVSIINRVLENILWDLGKDNVVNIYNHFLFSKNEIVSA